MTHANSYKVTKLADRLEACVKQIGQPDYSLGDLYRDCLEIAADMRGLPSLSGPSHDWQNCVRCGAAILNNHPDATSEKT